MNSEAEEKKNHNGVCTISKTKMKDSTLFNGLTIKKEPEEETCLSNSVTCQDLPKRKRKSKRDKNVDVLTDFSSLEKMENPVAGKNKERSEIDCMQNQTSRREQQSDSYDVVGSDSTTYTLQQVKEEPIESTEEPLDTGLSQSESLTSPEGTGSDLNTGNNNPKASLKAAREQKRKERRQRRRKEQLECEVCAKVVNRSSMAKHLKTHSKGKRFQCGMCDSGYNRIDHFHKHMAFHFDEKPFKCPICEKGFKEDRKMRKHMSTHSDDRPYICSLCYKAFSDSSALYKHLRAHNGVKPYECSVCGKTFNESSKVVRHMRIHTGEKPFACPVCSRAFNDKSSMSKHIRTHKLDDELVRKIEKASGGTFEGIDFSFLDTGAAREEGGSESPVAAEDVPFEMANISFEETDDISLKENNGISFSMTRPPEK